MHYPFCTPHVSSALPVATQKHRYTFCGKEEQRIAQSIPAQFKVAVMDQGARYYIPSTMQFTSQDPLAIKYPHISPYTYCAANPILYVDPDGRDWITATYDGESFCFYDKRVKNQEDIETHYGEDNQISYFGTSGSVSNAGAKFNLNKDGSFEINGKVATVEYNKEGSMHIGNDTFTDMEMVGENIYGNYLGGDNPKSTTKSKADSYALPPINSLDYSAYRHDKRYDDNNAYGIKGILAFRTTKADISLIYNSVNYTIHNYNFSNSWFVGSGVNYLFIMTTGIKTLLKATPFSGVGLIYNLIDK